MRWGNQGKQKNLGWGPVGRVTKLRMKQRCVFVHEMRCSRYLGSAEGHTYLAARAGPLLSLDTLRRYIYLESDRQHS